MYKVFWNELSVRRNFGRNESVMVLGVRVSNDVYGVPGRNEVANDYRRYVQSMSWRRTYTYRLKW